MVLPPTISDRVVWTVSDLEALPRDGNRYEILHGELLVSPLPALPHQGVATRLTVALLNWCRAYVDWTIRAPGGVYISEATWLEPDIAVYPCPEFSVRRWQELPPPVLVVEVLSPSTTKTDRHRKRPAYLAHGVHEVWLIDEEARSVERWTKDALFPEPLGASPTWAPSGIAESLTVRDDELFGPRINRA
jgi:Uma2 family endonuclease